MTAKLKMYFQLILLFVCRYLLFSFPLLNGCCCKVFTKSKALCAPLLVKAKAELNRPCKYVCYRTHASEIHFKKTIREIRMENSQSQSNPGSKFRIGTNNAAIFPHLDKSTAVWKSYMSDPDFLGVSTYAVVCFISSHLIASKFLLS